MQSRLGQLGCGTIHSFSSIIKLSRFSVKKFHPRQSTQLLRPHPDTARRKNKGKIMRDTFVLASFWWPLFRASFSLEISFEAAEFSPASEWWILASAFSAKSYLAYTFLAAAWASAPSPTYLESFPGALHHRCISFWPPSFSAAGSYWTYQFSPVASSRKISSHLHSFLHYPQKSPEDWLIWFPVSAWWSWVSCCTGSYRSSRLFYSFIFFRVMMKRERKNNLPWPPPYKKKMGKLKQSFAAANLRLQTNKTSAMAS